MGMHHGIVAANGPWKQFFEALGRNTGDFVFEGEVADLGSERLEARDEGFTLIAGEHRGCSYVLDSSMMISMAAEDFLEDLSKETGLLIVGCGAETVSGTFSFYAARAGKTIRWFHHCYSALRKGMAVGDPLPTEKVHPLTDLDGVGLTHAMAHLGFDFDGWMERGPFARYLYTARELSEPNSERGICRKGRLREISDLHYKSHELAPKDVPPLQVIERDSKTGKVTDRKTLDVNVHGVRTSRKSWFRRFFGRGDR